MNTKSMLQQLGLSLVGVLGAASSLYAATPLSQLPPEHTQGIASFVSGGVSEDEARRFEAASKRYPLVVQLFEHAGHGTEYTADARVRITDRHDRVVLDQKADGPFMLVHLPAGDYKVAASLNGRDEPARPVHVTDGGHARATFVFAQNAG